MVPRMLPMVSSENFGPPQGREGSMWGGGFPLSLSPLLRNLPEGPGKEGTRRLHFRVMDPLATGGGGSLEGFILAHVSEWVRPLCKFQAILLTDRLRWASPGSLGLYSPDCLVGG